MALLFVWKGMIYISPLSSVEYESLKQGYLQSKDKSFIKRCHCVISSSQRVKVSTLAKIFKTRTRTIYIWLHLFSTMGIEGLATKQGRGRKSKLVDLLPEQVDSIIKNVRLNPQSLREVAAVLYSK